jgi:hypothetical protein
MLGLLRAETAEFEAVLGTSVEVVADDHQRWIIRDRGDSEEAPTLAWDPARRELTSFADSVAEFATTLNLLHTLAWSRQTRATDTPLADSVLAVDRIYTRSGQHIPRVRTARPGLGSDHPAPCPPARTARRGISARAARSRARHRLSRTHRRRKRSATDHHHHPRTDHQHRHRAHLRPPTPLHRTQRSTRGWTRHDLRSIAFPPSSEAEQSVATTALSCWAARRNRAGDPSAERLTAKGRLPGRHRP